MIHSPRFLSVQFINDVVVHEQGRGAGYELETFYPQWKRVHKPLENPTTTMDSLTKLIEACNDVSSSVDRWLSRLDASDWLGNVKELLTVACLTAQCMDQVLLKSCQLDQKCMR
jgi:myotubularin-related protein 9